MKSVLLVPCLSCPVESRCLDENLALDCKLIEDWTLDSLPRIRDKEQQRRYYQAKKKRLKI